MAFDSVDKTVFLRKLSLIGMKDRELLIFKSYLSQRRQYVKIYESKKSILDVKFGVPQGSLIDPL